MRQNRWLMTAALLSSAVAAPAFAQITNGGFENAPTAPPTPGDWQYNNGAARDGTSVHGGSFAANLNNITGASNVNVLEQTPFGSISPGVGYTLKFWSKASYGVAGEGQLQVEFLDAGGGILPGSPMFTQIPASADFALNSSSLTAPANASAFFIAFNAVTGAVDGATSHLFVDDVSLSVVPEPTTLAGLAISGVALTRRRK